MSSFLGWQFYRLTLYYVDCDRENSTPPQTDWLINDSREIIKENSYFFFPSSSYHFISYPILFICFLNFRPMSWDSLKWILQ